MYKQDHGRAVADFQVEVIIQARDAGDRNVGAIDQSNGVKRAQYR